MKKGCLHLLPSLLDSQAKLDSSVCASLYEVLETLDGFFVETPKVARAYLKKFNKGYHRLEMLELDKRVRDFSEHLKVLKEGKTIGLLSDAGLPCLADPGARLVDAARENGIEVKAHVGPSSIYLALMHSGFYSQKFIFHGYFPKELKKGFIGPGVHVFIETPYRIKYTFEALLLALDKKDRVMLGVNLTGPDEKIIRATVGELEKQVHDIHKKEVIFVIEILKREQSFSLHKTKKRFRKS